MRGAPEAALVLLTAVWGSTFIVVKLGLDGLGPLGFVALRFVLAALLLNAMFIPAIRRATRRDWRATVTVGIWLLAGYVFQTVGLQLTTASKGGFLTGLSVVLVPFVVWIWQRQAPEKRFAAGATISFVGLAVLSLPADLTPELGDALVLGCAVAFAVHIVALGRAARRHDVRVLVTGQVTMVAGCALALALVFEGPPVPASGAAWFGVAYTGIVATVGVLLVQAWAQTRVSANRTAIILAGEPVFAALFAAFVGGEVLGWRDLAGGGLIVTGMLLAVADA